MNKEALQFGLVLAIATSCSTLARAETGSAMNHSGARTLVKYANPMCGSAGAARRLDAFFTKLNDGVSSQYAYLGNEPCLETPWIYDFLGEPWKTQGIMRRAMTELYSAQFDGYPGNDDLGEMSSWYVFGALGMYPEIPGSDIFVLGSPLFHKTIVHLASGDLKIMANGAGGKAPYVQSLTIGGRAWDKPWLRFSDISSGQTLVYGLSSTPNENWGNRLADAPPSFGATAVQTQVADPPSPLAQTPPMGWNSWNCFHLDINDEIIRAEAAALVKSGMKKAGYEYVVIDGGWEGWHDTNGVFHSDPQKFPDMKALCDYVHSLGLKIGIHTSPGPTTCAGHEASYGHEKQDAETFARWGIDFVKYDWCSADKVYRPDQMQEAYKKFSDDLKATGRPILYSLCQYGIQDVWKWGASVGGQMWRTTGDISDNYDSVMLHGLAQNGLEKFAGPGHWNDPDMLEIGNGKLNEDECRSQMSLWCILAAPLFAGNDLTQMSASTLAILTNPEAIAVDQDPAGIQGHCAWQEGPTEIWTKRLSDGGVAVGIFNLNPHPMAITADFHRLGLPETLQLRDLWKHKDLGTFHRAFTVTVPRHASVLLKVKSNQ